MVKLKFVPDYLLFTATRLDKMTLLNLAINEGENPVTKYFLEKFSLDPNDVRLAKPMPPLTLACQQGRAHYTHRHIELN